MELKRECIVEVDHKRIVFEEKRSKLTLANDSRTICQRIKVDGCQIVQGPKCDFALFNDKTECYIELNGQDIDRALEQIVATMKSLSSDPSDAPKLCFVICTRVTYASAKIQDIQKKFRMHYKAKLFIQKSGFEHPI